MTIELIATIISGILMIASVIIGNIILSKNQHQDRLNDTITRSRIKWLNIVRDEIANFISKGTIILLFRDNKHKRDININPWEIINEFSILSSRIVLRLNPKEDLNLINKIKEVTGCVMKDKQYNLKDFDNDTNEIIIKSQNILKNEWEKIKTEVITGKIKFIKKYLKVKAAKAKKK